MLSFGPLTRTEITLHVMNEEWQKLRVSLAGTTLERRYSLLREWLKENNTDRASQVQVTNYINALKRGGMIK